MEIKNGKIVFKSGKIRSASQEIIGLGPDDSVSDGYDHHIWDTEDGDAAMVTDPLTPDDLVDLADFMIARWTEFRTRAALRR